MSRTLRMLLLMVTLSLVLTPAMYAKEKPTPPPPEDGVVGSYEYPQPSTKGDMSPQALGDVSPQGTGVSCTINANDPTYSIGFINGNAFQVCAVQVFQTIQVCVQVFRYYTTWVNLVCNPVKRSSFATHTWGDTASELCLKGRYWYRVRAYGSFVDLDGSTGTSPYVYSNDIEILC